MTGMTAPKLLWIAEHEPDIFRHIAQVLLPKDYLRWKLSCCYATDMSDASGTLWLNVATRQWDETLLDACGLTLQQVPLLLEGPQVSGYLREEYQQRWGFSSAIPIVAGGGDYAAGAVGVGVWQSGQAMLSLGTSGVYFVVGLLTTIGLSAKNAILIVEFAKDEIELAGKGLIEATLSAVRMRLRPILMTSMAFILGVLPLALGSGAGSGAQNAVGTGVIGGMIAATLLAIYFVPIFFVVIRRRFPGKPKEGEE